MKENIEEEKAIKYYQNKDISFSVDYDTKELLEALGITEEDSFEEHQIRFETLLNLIEKLQKENEELKQSLIINKNLYEELCNKNNELKRDNELARQALKEQCDIVDERNQLLKENKDWQKAYQEEKDKQDELALHIITLVKKVNNSIPKQRIKDKIEELNKKEQELQNSISDEEREEYSDASISFDLMDIHIRREELQRPTRRERGINMTTEEAQKVLDEMQSVRPELLNDEAKRLFEAIMKIADERDSYKSMLEEKDKVIDLMAEEIMVDDNFMCEFDFKEWETKEEIKQYFENKVRQESDKGATGK